MIELWTDGSANPNPGPGGFAVLDKDGNPLIARKSNREDTTNIRMEGWALIAAMTYAHDRECEIHTDSMLWINILEKWAPGRAASTFKCLTAVVFTVCSWEYRNEYGWFCYFILTYINAVCVV